MRLTPKQTKLLKLSIAHWKRHATDTAAPKEGISANSCALCLAYFKNSRFVAYCTGCPIAKKTGQSKCKGSPWLEAHAAYYIHGSGSSSKEFMAEAQRMVDFMQSILPKPRTTKKR